MKADVIDELFRKYYNEALLYTLSLCRHRELAEDIVSTAFFKALETADDRIGSFKPWLLAVCRNEFFTWCRKHRREADEPPAEGPRLAEADAGTVKAARRRFNLLSILRIVVVSLCVCALIAGGTLWYIFGTANAAARSSAVYSRDDAVDLAEGFVAETYGVDRTAMVVHDVDRRHDFSGGLKRTVFVYEVELRADGVEYELRINAHTGHIFLSDISTW